MSKKHKKFQQQNYSSGSYVVSDHAAEYKIIKGDLLKVLIVNAIFLAGVLTLYFTNLNTRYLESMFDKFIKF